MTTEPTVDLDAYFARVGHDGPREPSLATLRALHALQPATIPFEAIDVLLDRGVDLSPAAVDAKLITARRGGYCYEQNGLFKRVLTALGFEVEGLIARVRWNAPPGAPPRPRSHMALKVMIDGEPWLADVGFGGCVLTTPLRMVVDEPQATPHERFRLVQAGRDLALEVELPAGWTPVYEASPEPQLDADYETANWHTATHPSSPFRQVLMVARTTPDARRTLLGNRFTLRRPDGTLDRADLDADGMAALLAGEFGLPVEDSWRPLLERAVAAGEAG